MGSLLDIVQNAHRIVVLTGAGISTNSGIPDYRGTSIHALPPETILSRKYFKEHTAEFFEYYTENMLHLEARPNQAHKALTALEEKGKQVTIVTQNIDGLHQQAGSSDVLELHGTINSNQCIQCRAEYTASEVYTLCTHGIPYCPLCTGIIKPGVTLYGEAIDTANLEKSIAKTKEADLFMVIGTSMKVAPANGIPSYFTGRHLITINYTELSMNTHQNTKIHTILGDICDILPRIVESI